MKEVTKSADVGLFLNQDGPYKVACLDIEASGLNADFSIVLCAVLKEYPRGKPKVFRIDITKRDLLNEEKELLSRLDEAISKFDGVITHYGIKFDIPFLRARMFMHGFIGKPGGIMDKLKHLDTYYTAKRVLCISSRRLGNGVPLLPFLPPQHPKGACPKKEKNPLPG